MSDIEAFGVMIPVDGYTREQIAGVAIHWSILELTVERVIANLEGKGGIVEYSDKIDVRVRKLKTLCKNTIGLNSEQKSELLTLASQILSKRKDRDRVIHGLWAMTESGGLTSIHPWAKDTLDKPLDAEAIRGIKLAIVRLHRQLEPFIDATTPVVLPWPRDRS